MTPAIEKIKKLAAIARNNVASNDRSRLEIAAISRPSRKKKDESPEHTEVKRNKTRQRFHKQIHSEAKDESDQDQAIKKVVKQRNKKDGQVVFAKKDEKEGKPNEGQEVMENKRERTRALQEAVINAAHRFGGGKALAPHQKVRTQNFNSMSSVAHFFKHKVKGHDAPRSSVTTAAAYEHYCKHCDDNNAFPHPQKKFHDEFRKHAKLAKISGRPRYVGIKLVESLEESYDSDFAWKKAIRGAKGKDRAALIKGHKEWAANKDKPKPKETPKAEAKPAPEDKVDLDKRRNAKLRGVHSVINELPSIHRATHGAMLTKLINSKDSETMKHISNDNMSALKNHIAHHVAQSKKRKPYLG